jgi:superfamily I DNA/RNA helicase
VARLPDEDIPYTVVGGLSLFESPEIRDLELCSPVGGDLARVRSGGRRRVRATLTQLGAWLRRKQG